MFVSAANIPATFAAPSGAAGNVADGLCQGYANAANLGGKWKAWLSDSTTSPLARFEHSTIPYTLIDGTTVASGWTQLVSGTLAHGIDMDEAGVLRSNKGVWTATDADGTALLSGGSVTFPIGTCSNFTMAGSGPTYPIVGLSGLTDATWSNVYDVVCDSVERLYCFEQP